METFIHNFSKHYLLPADVVRRFVDNLSLVRFTRGHVIVSKGEYNANFYLVKSGYVRGFIDVEGNDVTTWFSHPSEILFNSWSFALELKSENNIEALTDVEAFCINRNHLRKLCSESLEIANVMLQIMTIHGARYEENNVALFRCMTGKERFLWILKKYPQLIQNVPQKYIASYIELKPQSLSRIKNQIVKNKQ